MIFTPTYLVIIIDLTKWKYDILDPLRIPRSLILKYSTAGFICRTMYVDKKDSFNLDKI